MTSIKNHVQLIGRLGNTPELKHFASGKYMTSFSIAINEAYTNQNGEKIENTQWHTVTAWGKKADSLTKYLRKGESVLVRGKLASRSYEKDGEKRYVTEIQLSDFVKMSTQASN